MNHPYELLADLVDGTLDEDTLAGVQAHLDACASCRGDVADAVAGAEAARSLPLEAAPADLHRRVVTAGRGHGTPSWYRWAGVAAAAAVVAALAITIPNVGTGDSGGLTEEAGQADGGQEAADVFGGGEVPVEVRRGVNYDAGDLEELAKAPSPATPTSGEAAAQADTLATASAAVRCVTRAFDEQPAGRLARLIRARFEGEEAYIAIYLEGSGADEPPDTVAVWAASVDDCTILSFASART
jgi:Putative zinc-finger